MRILFIPGNSPSPIFSHASLATAARNRGHEVIVGGIEWVLPEIAAIGLAPVKIADISEADVAEFMSTAPADPVEQAKAVGRVYAEIALQSLDPLLRMAEKWRPDIVVGGSMFYCAPLLAHRLGVPSVRVEWDRVDAAIYAPRAAEVLPPLLTEWGLDEVPAPDLWVDICPPSLRPTVDPDRQAMRWLPTNPQRPLEPWMYAKGERPRVYITAGARLFSGESLSHMARSVSDLGVEVVIGAPERVAADLRKELPDIQVGWVPLDVLAPTCDIILHHGGGVTDMTALHAGVPQVIVNQDIAAEAMQRLADHGAAVMLGADEQNAEEIAGACARVLEDPRYRQRARALSAEMAELPPPAEIVALMEKLAG